MNVTVATADLLTALRRVEKVAPSKPPQPILTHTLITADAGALWCSATDLDMSVTSTCDAAVRTPGTVALPVKHLVEIVSQVTDADIRLHLDKRQVHLSAGYFTTRIQAMAPEDFPKLPTFEGSGALVAGEDFRRMIRKVRCAIVDTPQRYFLNGALLILSTEKKSMVMITTDGARLAMYHAGYAGTVEQPGILIPTKALDVIMQDDSGGDLSVQFTGQHLFFAGEHSTLASHTVDGQFPNWQRVIPKDNTLVVTVPTAPCLSALKRVSLSAGDLHVVTMTIDPGSLTMSASSAVLGDAVEKIAIGYEGPPLTFNVKAPLVLDFLDSVDNPTVTLHLKDGHTQSLWRDGDNYAQVIVLQAPTK